jgi:hypothetical protein
VGDLFVLEPVRHTGDQLRLAFGEPDPLRGQDPIGEGLLVPQLAAGDRAQRQVVDVYKVLEHPALRGQWNVERIDSETGECEVAMFRWPPEERHGFEQQRRSAEEAMSAGRDV